MDAQQTYDQGRDQLVQPWRQPLAAHDRFRQRQLHQHQFRADDDLRTGRRASRASDQHDAETEPDQVLHPRLEPVLLHSGRLQGQFQADAESRSPLGTERAANHPPAVQTSFDPVKGIPVQEGTDGFRTRMFDFDWRLFAPRIGFACQPTGDGKTVMRGGAGTFFSNFPIWNTISGIYAGYPVTIDNTYTSSLAQPVSLTDPFPASNAVTRNNLTGVERNQSYPRSYQWSLGIQRQVTNDMMFEATYMGKTGNHLRTSADINQPAPGAGTPAQVNARRPYPEYGPITFYKWDGNSRYHSIQSRIQQQYSNGLSFLASYTFSNSIDDTGGRTDAFDRRTARGASAFDIRHRLAMSPVYELPFGSDKPFLTAGVLSKILSGWQVSPLFQWQTGAPLTATLSGNFSNSGGTTDRPDAISDPNKSGRVLRKSGSTRRHSYSVPPVGL